MNNESTEVTLTVTSILEEMGVVYAIGGSLASTMHGVARSTLDSDIVADLRTEQVPALIASLENDFYLSDTAIYEAIRYRSSFNLIHLTSMFKIDIFLPKDRNLDRGAATQTSCPNPRPRAGTKSLHDHGRRHDPGQIGLVSTGGRKFRTPVARCSRHCKRPRRESGLVLSAPGRSRSRRGRPVGEIAATRINVNQTVRSPILCRHAASLHGDPSQTPKTQQSGASIWMRRLCSTLFRWARRDLNPRPHGCEPCALTS